MGLVGFPMGVAMAAEAFKPQNYKAGELNSGLFTNPDAPVTPAQTQKYRANPLSGMASAFGAQGGNIPDSDGSEGSAGEQNVPSSGDPWNFTESPSGTRMAGKRMSKFACGTTSGGVVYHPAETDLRDVEDYGMQPDGVTLSTMYVLVAPNAWFGAGIPELANGSLQDGYSWGMDTATGDLLFRSHSDSGDPSNAFRLGKTSQNPSWRSAMSSWGILDHAVTAERTWTFPDVTGPVGIMLTGVGTPSGTVTAPESTLYWDTSSDILYANNNGATSWIVIAGSPGGISGSGANTQVPYFIGTFTLSSDANFVYDYPNDKLILTGTTGPQQRWAYDGSNFTDVLSTAAGALEVTVSGRYALFQFDDASSCRLSVSNTGASDCFVEISGGVDAYVLVVSSGGSAWTFGLDDSATDAWKLSRGTALGTSDYLTVTTAGIVTVPQILRVGTATDAAAQGDFSAGLTSGNRTFFDQSDALWDVIQSSTGDAAIRFTLGTSRSFILGIDNSDADSLKISTAASGTAVLGTGDLITVETGGEVGINTTTPRRRLDVLFDSAAQIRLTQADESIYTDLWSNVSGSFIVAPQGNQWLVISSIGDWTGAATVVAGFHTFVWRNLDTSAGAGARIRIQGEGEDAAIQFSDDDLSRIWSVGLAASAAGTNFRISASSSLGVNKVFEANPIGECSIRANATGVRTTHGLLITASNEGITGAANEFSDLYVENTVKTFSVSIADQRDVYLASGTYNTAGGAITITRGTTLYVQGPPTPGSSVTITEPLVAWFDAGNVRIDDGLTVNEGGGDFDTRIEGDNKTSCFLIDASDDEVSIDGRFSFVPVTPAEITANQNDYDPESSPAARSSFWRLSSDAARTVTGLAGGLDGRYLIIRNVGTNNLTFSHESTLSSAANRMTFDSGGNYTLSPGRILRMIYDLADLRWVEA